ncbi:DUF4129 domain-containing protein [Amycolatopsis anabasis]|uniref:DUF4129 domain-containing protein n=1 Tax=Amycolatopsis anabasis TaxID=1840409 RepID=UPI00131C0112|nr:DUF4129 domain-containing protein [Amycolatopsis anabasis]
MRIPFPADVPVGIDRDDARAAAAAELAKPEYRAAEPSPLDQALNWIVRKFLEFLDATSGVVPGGPLGLLVLLVLLVVLVVVIRLRVGRTARGARERHVVFAETSRSASDYRRAAGEAAAAGEFAVAVREQFRAVVRGLEERGVLDERSGRTADEAAAEGGRRLPGCRDELAAGAALFDRVHYGGHPATEETYRRLVALEQRCQAERPVLAGVSG